VCNLTWDLRDHWGVKVAEGLYYLRVNVDAGQASATKILKVLVLN